MQQLITQLQTSHIPQLTCLITQLLLTLHTSLNLQRNKQQFPVKQLSPSLSLTALLCFFLINCISFTSKLIQTSNQYYNPQYHSQSNNCGQCRLYQNTQMIILAIIYNGLRQLPLIIFIVKTYRVCLCYTVSFEKQLSQRVKWLFSCQKKLLILSVLITIILMAISYVVYGQGTEHYGNLVFEFFCPKQSSVYDWLVTLLRFLAMAYVYIISIYTYNELDFKRFLILIFILTNTEVLLRLILAIAEITKTTYHEFYYHSFVMNLFGTLIMLYYSTIKEQRNQPLTLPIIESFKAFLQSSLGFTVLTLFAEELDQQQQLQLQKQQGQGQIGGNDNGNGNINSNNRDSNNRESIKSNKNNNNNNNRNSNNSRNSSNSNSIRNSITNSITNNISSSNNNISNNNPNSNKYITLFISYTMIQQINIHAYYNNYKVNQQDIQKLQQILSNQHISKLIDNSEQLLQKSQLQQITSIDLEQLSVKLYRFCEREIFNQWRQTQSCKYLQGEFKNNGVINLRMNDICIKLK